MQRANSLKNTLVKKQNKKTTTKKEKYPDGGKDWRQEEKGMTDDGWMASMTQWTWVWANSRGWWWIGKPSMLQSMGSQRIGHDWATEQQQALTAENETVCAMLSLSVVSDPMDCSPQAPPSIGILQARILEWVAMPSSGGSSRTRGCTQVSCIAGRFFTI